MPSRRTTPTRHVLLQTRKQLRAVEKGTDILDRRRHALVFLVQWLLERWRTQEDQLQEAFADAERARTEALEFDGIVALESAALARSDHPELLFLTQELEGIPVPLILSRGISKDLDDRGYGLLGTSAAIDETAATHERVLRLAVQQAELSASLSILLFEIRRLNVRINALEKKLIPDLQDRIDYIEFHLAEREREERLVQRFFKRKRESRDRDDDT